MPLRLGPSGKTAVELSGKVKRRFKSKAKAKKFIAAVNMAMKRRGKR